jgi:hypothetical protein
MKAIKNSTRPNKTIIRQSLCRKLIITKCVGDPKQETNECNKCRESDVNCTLDRVRVMEVTAGRLAIGGLFSTSIIGNFTGKPLVEQYNNEYLFVWCFVSIVVGWTVTKGLLRDGFKESDFKTELSSTRIAMIAMLIVGILEYIRISHVQN